MGLFRKRPSEPAIQLFGSEGESIPLEITFRNGEIHINHEAMSKGVYQLKISAGDREESRLFTVV